MFRELEFRLADILSALPPDAEMVSASVLQIISNTGTFVQQVAPNSPGATMSTSLDRVRRLLSSPRRQSVTLAEHEAIVRALQAGDSEEAGHGMERHLDAVVTELVAFARDNPAIFEDL